MVCTAQTYFTLDYQVSISLFGRVRDDEEFKRNWLLVIFLILDDGRAIPGCLCYEAFIPVSIVVRTVRCHDGWQLEIALDGHSYELFNRPSDRSRICYLTQNEP